MKRLLRLYRFTPVGRALLFVLLAALLVLLFGPRHDQRSALIVLGVVLAVSVSGVLRGTDLPGAAGKPRAERHREPRTSRPPERDGGNGRPSG